MFIYSNYLLLLIYKNYFISKNTQIRTYNEPTTNMSKLSKENSFRNYESIRFKSSDFSQRSNHSFDFRKIQQPSFSNTSSIRNVQQDQSSEFIYFQNDSAMLKHNQSIRMKKQASMKQNSIKNQSIQFEDSLINDNSKQKNDESEIIQYGTQQPNLPKTLKKPKFGFKVSQTAESSQIMNQIGEAYQLNKVNNFYQIKSNQSSKILHQKSQFQNVATSRISSIRKPEKQPSLRSNQINSLVSSDYIRQFDRKPTKHNNFGSVFKNKVQKASSLSLKNSRLSSISKRSGLFQNKIDNQIKVAQLQQLKQLQNKLGKLKKQNKLCIKYVVEKQKQIDQLQKKRQDYEQNDPYAILKQNQLMRAFLINKKQQKHQQKLLSGLVKSINSIRSLKQLSIKKGSNKALGQYDMKQIKLKIQPQILTKKQKKDLISNRAMILSNKIIDIGYSLKDNKVTLYLTLKQDFEQVCIKLDQNSFIYTESIDRVFRKILTGKQIKFKTEVLATKPHKIQDILVPSTLHISIRSQYKFQTKLEQYKVQIPLRVYNIARQIKSGERNINNNNSNINQYYKTPLFACCNELIKDTKSVFLKKIFPLGEYHQDQQIFMTSFLWKQNTVNIKIKLKQRQFMIEGEGNPLKSGHQLIKSIISLLTIEKEQNLTR